MRDSALPASPLPGVHVGVCVEPDARGSAQSFARGWQQRLRGTARALWQAEQPGRGGDITIIFTGAEQIRRLNREFRRKDRATDVLAFDLSDSPDVIEGEVYLSVDAARRRARNLSYSALDEVARLMVHGLLHLAGYDHHTPPDGRRMAAASRRWLVRWDDKHGV